MGKVFKGKELMETIKPLRWIWEPLIPRAFITVLASRGGVGKTGFSLWLANKLKSEGMEVLYVDYESCGPHHKQRRSDWNLPYLDDIYFYGEDGQTCGVKDENELEMIVNQVRPDLIILDSLTSLLNGRNVDSRQEMAKLQQRLTNIAVKNDCGILELAHNRKKQMQDLDINTDSVAGSAGITDMARSVLMMDFGDGSDKRERIIRQKKSNFAAASQDLKMIFDSDGIHEVSFVPNRENMITIFQQSGSKADKFRAVAEREILNGKTKRSVTAHLKENEGATPTEASRAIQDVCIKLGFKWEGEK